MSENIPLVKKKRGRKPKKIKESLPIKKLDVNSEEEPIITHLKLDSDNLYEEDEDIDDIFIKNEPEIEFSEQTETINIDTETQNLKLLECVENLNKHYDDFIKSYNIAMKMIVSKFCVMESIYKEGMQCWWCRHSFNTVPIGLPVEYKKGKFYCEGIYCSYNCALAHNIDIGDENVSKRTSLLYMLYHKIHKKDKKIKEAGDWRTLKSCGGSVEIEQYRMDFLIDTIDYTLLRPPMETRYTKTEIINNNKDKRNLGELVLKRENPTQIDKYSLSKSKLIKTKTPKS